MQQQQETYAGEPQPYPTTSGSPYLDVRGGTTSPYLSGGSGASVPPAQSAAQTVPNGAAVNTVNNAHQTSAAAALAAVDHWAAGAADSALQLQFLHQHQEYQQHHHGHHQQQQQQQQQSHAQQQIHHLYNNNNNAHVQQQHQQMHLMVPGNNNMPVDIKPCLPLQAPPLITSYTPSK